MVFTCSNKNIHCYDSTCASHYGGWIQHEVNQIHPKKGGNFG